MVQIDTALESIKSLVARLTAEDGCPWDRQQSPRSLGIYLVEEVFELVDAIERGDNAAIAEELGDVLFQIVFMCFLLEKSGVLDLAAVVQNNVAKMKRRHPHVFGDVCLDDAEKVRNQWQEIKMAEKKANGFSSVLDGVPDGLPALLRAYRISQRAAGVGFDWDDLDGVMDKAREEWAEMEQEYADCHADSASEGFKAEFGDLLFTLVNVGRLAGFHPETALVGAIHRFERRFKQMEQLAQASSTSLERLEKDRLEQLWNQVKENEGAAKTAHLSGEKDS